MSPKPKAVVNKAAVPKTQAEPPEILFVAGDVQLRARLLPIPTVKLLLDILPFQGTGLLWGQVMRIEVPLEAYREPGASLFASLGDVLWSPDHDELLIAFGPTPVSAKGEIRLISPSTRIGAMLDDVAALQAVPNGTMITIVIADAVPRKRGLGDPRRGKGKWFGQWD